MPASTKKLPRRSPSTCTPSSGLRPSASASPLPWWPGERSRSASARSNASRSPARSLRTRTRWPARSSTSTQPSRRRGWQWPPTRTPGTRRTHSGRRCGAHRSRCGALNTDGRGRRGGLGHAPLGARRHLDDGRRSRRRRGGRRLPADERVAGVARRERAQRHPGPDVGCARARRRPEPPRDPARLLRGDARAGDGGQPDAAAVRDPRRAVRAELRAGGPAGARQLRHPDDHGRHRRWRGRPGLGQRRSPPSRTPSRPSVCGSSRWRPSGSPTRTWG